MSDPVSDPVSEQRAGHRGARIFPLDNRIRDYAWGSRTAIPELLGRAPTDRPAAELWLGAHPDDPSRLAEHPDRLALDELIATDPVRLLGSATSAQFGGKLPFLMKLLAADHALSIQVHPTLDQARTGFANEEARGVPRDSPARTYRDANHKPEMLCALTEFEAFCGFRPVAATSRLLAELIAAGADALRPYLTLLSGPDGLRTAFCVLLDTSEEERAILLPQVEAAVAAVARSGGEFAAAAAAAALAGSDFPGDIGGVVVLLLNYVRLRPGESIFLGAGNVHAYLRGLGVEILASSDNVLRGGLTPKHIDVPELLAVADFAPLEEPRSPAVAVSPGCTVYPAPVPDFRLCRLTPAAGPVELAAPVPYLLLATAGSVELDDGAEQRSVSQGSGVFIAAGDTPVTVRGAGTAFAATVNLGESP